MAVYNSRMSVGMEDKLFFLPFLKKSPLLIDYGCADGTLAKYIKDIYPDAVIYGYDIDENMLELAKQKLGDENDYLSNTRVFEVLKLTIAFFNSLFLFKISSIFLAQFAQSKLFILYLYFFIRNSFIYMNYYSYFFYYYNIVLQKVNRI